MEKMIFLEHEVLSRGGNGFVYIQQEDRIFRGYSKIPKRSSIIGKHFLKKPFELRDTIKNRIRGKDNTTNNQTH